MPPTPRPSPSDETELLPLSSRSSAVSSSLPPPLPTPPSPASFFKSIREKAAEAAAAAAAAAVAAARSEGGLLPTSSTSPSSPERRRRRRGRDGRQRDCWRQQRRRLLAAAAAAALLLSLFFVFSYELVLAGKESSQREDEKKRAFGQRTAELVHEKTIKPAAEAAAVASLRVRAVAAAAASRASFSLSATAEALSAGAPPSAEEQGRGRRRPSRPTRPISDARPLTAFVGVQSRPVTPRRQRLRETWFPSSPEERERLLAPSPASASSSASAAAGGGGSPPRLGHRGIAFRFVVGLSADPGENLLVAEENRAHDNDILVLESVRESYDNLVLKSVAFFSAAVEAFPGASFVVKIDDDVYVRPDNLALVANQWEEAGRDYVGCLMKGGEAFDDKKSVYYEPLHALLPNRKYFGYMSGSAYALSRRAALLLRSRTTTGEEGADEAGEAGGEPGRGVGGGPESSSVLSGPLGGLRPMACEDCAVGLWLLAHNVRHGEDRRLCRYDDEIEVEVEGEEVEGAKAAAATTEAATTEAAAAAAATKARRKRRSCAAPGTTQAPLMAPVVLTNRCNGLCNPLESLSDLHADAACRAPTLGAEGGGVVGVVGVVVVGGGGGGGEPSPAGVSLGHSNIPALPLGDFWASGSGLSRADAVALECIRFTAEGDVDKSACKEEGKKARKKATRRKKKSA